MEKLNKIQIDFQEIYNKKKTAGNVLLRICEHQLSSKYQAGVFY
jgi:hypothetical protein